MAASTSTSKSSTESIFIIILPYFILNFLVIIAVGIATAKTTPAKTYPLTLDCIIPFIIWPLVHPPANLAPNHNKKTPKKKGTYLPKNLLYYNKQFS